MGERLLISMDGKGRCKANIWIERFWRSIKRDYIYTHPTDDVMKLQKGIDGCIRFTTARDRIRGSTAAHIEEKELVNCQKVGTTIDFTK